MRTATTRPPAPSTLYLAFELGNSEWVLAMTTRMDQPPLRRDPGASTQGARRRDRAREGALRLANDGAGLQLLRSRP